jgi:regulator of protease activity HflC (stomatin/prohibitin superfamily)
MPQNRSDRSILAVVGGVILLAIVLVFGLVATCTMRTTVDNGTEGVVVKRPLLFGHGGVADTPLKTGTYYKAWTTDIVPVNMLPVQLDATFEDLMTSDSIPLDFHAVIRLQTYDSVKLFKKFGYTWYDSNVAIEFATAVRQAVRNHGMNETIADSRTIASIDNEVYAHMQAYLKRIDMPVHLIAVTVGKANPPKDVLEQRIQTAREQQRQITMVQTQKAEEARMGAEAARARADNAYRVDMGLSPDQFLQLERIKMQENACANGTCIFSDGKTPVLVGGK